MIPTKIFSGVIRDLTKAPRGYYVELPEGFKGPFRSEADARKAIGPATLSKDGGVHAAGAVIWWNGRPG